MFKSGRQPTKSGIEINGEAWPLRYSEKSYGLPQMRLSTARFLPLLSPSHSLSPSLSLPFTISNFFFYCLLFPYEEKAAHGRSRISTASLLSIVRLNRHFLNSEKVNDLGHESSHIHLQGFDCEIFQESRIAVLSLRNSGFRMESRV